jgi:hypothetical protein
LGHNRVCQCIFLDLAEDDEADDTQEAKLVEATEAVNLHISLNAGIRTSETMQVRLQLGGASLLALLDSGSTHNFIFEEAAARTSLQHMSKGNMKVTVSNGERMPCPGVYRAMAFSISGEGFTTTSSRFRWPATTLSSVPSGWPRWG